MAFAMRNLCFSDQFAINCGTATVDLEKSKVLLVCMRRTGEYMLPKGRKDLHETLEQAALRETFEEAGIRVDLLPVPIKTHATTPSSLAGTGRPTTVTEPIAVTQRIAQGILKMIFWYVGSRDSTDVREEGTQQENEEFDTVWVGFDSVASTLSFEDDRHVVQAAIEAVRREAREDSQ